MSVHGYKDLLAHAGHKIECVTYGDPKDPYNVSLECTTCNDVIMDFECGDDDDGPDYEAMVNEILKNKAILPTLIGAHKDLDKLIAAVCQTGRTRTRSRIPKYEHMGNNGEPIKEYPEDDLWEVR